MTKVRRAPIGRDDPRRWSVRWALFASVAVAVLVALMALGAFA